MSSVLAAGIQFAGRAWALPVGGLWLAAMVVLVWSHGRGVVALPDRTRRWCFALKALGFTLLALCLLEPEYVREVTEDSVEKGVNVLALVYDNSLGMGLADPDRDRPAEFAAATWREELGETFRLREYVFDQQLRRGGPGSLDYGGEGSRIGGALRAVNRRTSGESVSGIVLFTDGNTTEFDAEGLDVASLPPVWPVVLGREEAVADLALGRVTATQTTFEEAPVTLRIPLRATGCAGRTVHVELLEEDGTLIEAREVVPATGEEVLSLEFRHRPLEAGVQVYRVEVTAEGLDEATLDNNQRFASVVRGRGPHRVLYVSGRPNWEYKFLHRALEADREVEMAGLIRMAKREPKFAFRGRGGESSNPLFRGFGDELQEDAYDQPVLIRMYVKDENELVDGFPDEAEELFPYRAVILDDVEAEFFSVDQMELLERYVGQRGGGLLMLGGQECFGQGGYADSAVADMLPVYARATAPAGERLRLDLTREGWLQPWVRLHETEDEERQRLGRVPPFKSVNTVAAIKPGASVLAQVIDNGQRRPALVSQRFGHGRVGALLVADLWRWGFRDPAQRPDMERAWRQTVRWLIADVPDRVGLTVEQNGGTARLVATVKDAEHRPDPEAELRVEVTGPDGETVTLSPTASLDEPGRYEAACRAEATGAWRAKAVVPEVGEALVAWTRNPAADELLRLRPRREWLRRLAARTGGDVVEVEALDQLPERIPHPTVRVTETKVTSLWHLPIVFLAAVGAFLGEWWLRRTRGAA